jgi:SAM-dependent methyltransferase
MQAVCPLCNQATKPNPTCAHYRDGVCRVIPPELAAHMAKIQRFQQGMSAQPPISDYNTLPYALKHTQFQWRIRCYDVGIVMKALGSRPNQRVLELGAWNGWLSHHIARAGHDLTAVDYSADTEQGIGAMKHYDISWHAVQSDLLNVVQFGTDFDAVVRNHGSHLLPDPVGYIEQLTQLIRPGGVLIVLGLMIYADPARRHAQKQQQDDAMRQENDQSFFLRPTRGYLDHNDRRQLQNLGLKLKPYTGMWRANLKARFVRQAPAYYYGVYSHPNAIR